jgi:Domain of unknown function (DUF3597)
MHQLPMPAPQLHSVAVRRGVVVTSKCKEHTMSILGNIMSAVRGAAKAARAGTAQASQSVTMAEVDVDAVLTKLSAQQKEKLDWRSSIVDLMKLLKLDSSLSARKELAHELGYKGNTSDTAAMNIWLHKQVMQNLAQNGGKVSSALLH